MNQLQEQRLINLLSDICMEAIKSVEYDDWPELQFLVQYAAELLTEVAQ